jgi:exosortase E/protease (VPEID-CTERM system)
LIARLGIIAAVLVVETLLVSSLIQRTPIELVADGVRVFRDVQHWLFRFMIGYAVILAALVYLRGADLLASISALGRSVPIRATWAIVHGVLLVPFALLSAGLYGGTLPLPFAAVAIGCAIAAALALFAAMAPLPLWRQAVRKTAALPAYALLPAAAAVLAIQGSQLLWAPTAKLTFRLVQLLLIPVRPSLHSDFSTFTLATDNFSVRVSEVCSGLEGVGLMLVFCATWLWYFRREYYFPRALIIVPAAVLLIFLLNAVRIAALVLIGDAGYAGIASVGFHSQAGWIAFNLTALGVAIVGRRSAWLHRHARGPAVSGENPTAAYLMPLLTILAAGMIAHALSAGFDLLYPLRLAGAILVLGAYRHSYTALDWRFTWRGPAVGALLFCAWVAFAHFMTTPTPPPAALASLPAPGRAAWLVCRVLAATVTVPIAEELAYRGYLLRRLSNADFQAVRFENVRWPALALCAAAFGVSHGSMWLAGVVAGLAYGALIIKTGRFGEAVIAHATTNALLAGYVMLYGQWQLW